MTQAKLLSQMLTAQEAPRYGDHKAWLQHIISLIPNPSKRLKAELAYMARCAELIDADENYTVPIDGKELPEHINELHCDDDGDYWLDESEAEKAGAIARADMDDVRWTWEKSR